MDTSFVARAAIWVLDRFVTGPFGNAIAGDLLEQYGGGRSPWWLGRQTLGAVVIGGWRDLHAHWLLAFRAIAVAALTYNAVATASVLWLGGRSFSVWSFYCFQGAWYFVAAFFTARLHRRAYAGTTVLLLLLVLLFNLPDLLRTTINMAADPRYRPAAMDRVEYLLVAWVSTGIGILMCGPGASAGDAIRDRNPASGPA